VAGGVRATRRGARSARSVAREGVRARRLGARARDGREGGEGRGAGEGEGGPLLLRSGEGSPSAAWSWGVGHAGCWRGGVLVPAGGVQVREGLGDGGAGEARIQRGRAGACGARAAGLD